MLASTRDNDLRAVSLHGRLGNQLFQYGMLRKVLGRESPVPVETLAVSAEPLARLLLPGRVRTLSIGECITLHRPPPLTELARRNVRGLLRRSAPSGIARRWLSARCAREVMRGRYDPELLKAPTPCLFQGFFQHERYVAGAGVLADLRPPTDRAWRRLETLREQHAGRALVAVIVRAGADYARLDWGQTVDWFVEACRMVAATVDRPAFVLFSDVPLVASAFAALLAPLGPAAVAGADLGSEDQLHVAARCEHAVLSSSSFAWWAAFLGDELQADAERVVVAPEPWIFLGDETGRARWRRLPSERCPIPPDPEPFV
jgi:hypothetical protein